MNLRYAGQYFDAETGLHYNNARYYDPKVGRYITSDPIGLEGGLNTYLYAKANPLRFSDPSGTGPIVAGACAALDVYKIYSDFRDLEKLSDELEALKPEIRGLENKCYADKKGTDEDFQRLRDLQKEALKKTHALVQAKLRDYSIDTAIFFGCAALMAAPTP